MNASPTAMSNESPLHFRYIHICSRISHKGGGAEGKEGIQNTKGGVNEARQRSFVLLKEAPYIEEENSVTNA